MITQPNDGGPAFPSPDAFYPSGQVQTGTYGMSMRDYFAACALVMPAVNDITGGSDWADKIAKGAYQIADAMLVERARKTGGGT